MTNKTHISLIGVKVVGETIELHSQNQLSFISNGTELIDCDIRIRCSASNYMLLDATLRNCRIWAHKPQNSAEFTETKFYDCKFKGRFNDCEFGNKPDRDLKEGCIKNCDFSEAILKDCFFYETEASDAIWPEWPHIGLSNLYDNKEDWLSISFPDKFRIWQKISATHYEGKRVQIINLELNNDVDSPEDFWALVQDKDYVFFPGKDLKQKHPQEYVEELSKRNQKDRDSEDERLAKLLLHEAVVDGKISSFSYENQVLILELNMDLVRNYLDSFPESVQVKFDGVKEVRLSSKDGKETFPLNSLIERNFKVLSVDEKKKLTLKGHSKKAGNLIISGDLEWSLLNEDINPDELKKARKEYYKIRYDLDDDDWDF